MRTLRQTTIAFVLAEFFAGVALAADPSTPSIDRRSAVATPTKPLVTKEMGKKLQGQAETRPGINPALRSAGCPDPAVVLLDYRVDNRYLGSRINYTVRGTIRNQGVAPFQSGPNQQEIHLVERETNKSDLVVLTRRFQNLRPGEEVRISYSTYIDVGIGTHPVARDYQMTIVYDLDINNDKNPRNDDCKSNNSKWIRLDPRHFRRERLRVP